MRRQIARTFLIGGAAILLSWPTSSNAESPIQAFVSPDGRIVFTNAFEPAPEPAPVAQPEGAPLAASPGRSATNTPESIPSLVRSISNTHGVDPDLVSAMMKVESNNDRWARSPKGALGLMQLIPATGRRFGVKDFFDPRQNIEGGVRYLKFLLEKFKGNIDLSLAAYNAGENLVERLQRIPAITETKNYVRKIKAIYRKNSSPILASDRELVAEKAPNSVAPEVDVIFRTVDERGVIRFSNIGPPN